MRGNLKRGKWGKGESHVKKSRALPGLTCARRAALILADRGMFLWCKPSARGLESEALAGLIVRGVGRISG